MNRQTCFKFPHEIVDNLNIAYSTTNNMIVFWNKYQLFLINEDQLEVCKTNATTCQLIFHTEFVVNQVKLSTNHVFCLDDNGNLFAYALKFKQIVHKKPKLNFQKLQDNILCIDCMEDLLFSIKLDRNEWYLRIDKVNSELHLHSQTVIENRNWPYLPSELKRNKCILRCFIINNSEFDSLHKIFRNKTNLGGKQVITVLSFDKLTLYAVLLELRSDTKTLTAIDLLTCPSEINNIDIIKEDFLNMIICLSSGTIIKIPLNDKFKTPSITHLNTAINNFIIFKEKIVYSDGVTMWISTNTFAKPDAKLRQLFVKQIKDFIKIDDRIICTTYSKLVYILNLNEESSYLVPIASSEYYSAEHLFNNMTYLHRIMEEVEKNDEIIKNIKKEEDYITTLALSNRQDFMNEIIQYNVHIYDNYEDILKEGLVLNLTNNLMEYFDADSFHVLIKIIPNNCLQLNCDDILSNIFADTKIYITILSQQRIVKTVSFKVVEQLKSINIVIPLSMKKYNVIDISVDISIVKKIPKVLDRTENLYITLYCKQVVLTPEHFIKTGDTSNSIRLLKDPEDSIENLIYKIAYKHHGHIFRITKVSENLFTWSFYVKLPSSYKELLQNESFYKHHFNSTKAKYLIKKISSEEFLNSERNISLNIQNEKLDIEIVPAEFFKLTKLIKVCGTNPLLVLKIRNFFAHLIHNNYQGYQPCQEFLSCNIFGKLEKTEKYLKEKLPLEEFFKIYEQYQIYLCASLV